MQYGYLTEDEVVLRNLAIADLLRKSIGTVIDICEKAHISETRRYLLSIFFLWKDRLQHQIATFHSIKIDAHMAQQQG
jgi:hypothetical protein